MKDKNKMSDEEMLRRLSAHPQIRNRIASLLSAVDDTAGDLKLADGAELRLTQKLQRMGQEAMQAWASTQVIARGRSRLLERVLTDFGADLPYARAMDKVVEHYGIVIAESTIRRVTLRHAGQIHKYSQGAPQGLPKALGLRRTVIVQTDGTMVPTVQSSHTAGDKRKNKSVQWNEAKISLAHVVGSKEMSFAATLQGDVQLAGRQAAAQVRLACGVWQRPPGARSG